MYSQNNEDEIIAEIFEKIGTKSKVFVEIGAGDGSECNTRALREQGWMGVAVDANHAKQPVQKMFVTVDNILKILESIPQVGISDTFPYKDIDFLSIDIDGNDYHLLHSVLQSEHEIRVICIEYNKHFGDKNIVMGYDENYAWDGVSTDYGASKTALIKLCEQYGYEFWGTDENEVNCFFVHSNA